MVRFYFVITWGEADGVERPLLDFLVGWDIVPSFEFFFGTLGFPVAPIDALFVAIDTAVDRVRVFVFGIELAWVVRDVCLELLTGFLLGEWDVASDFTCDFCGDGVKHDRNSVMMIEMIVRMTMMMSLSLWCVFVIIDNALPFFLG